MRVLHPDDGQLSDFLSPNAGVSYNYGPGPISTPTSGSPKFNLGPNPAGQGLTPGDYQPTPFNLGPNPAQQGLTPGDYQPTPFNLGPNPAGQGESGLDRPMPMGGLRFRGAGMWGRLQERQHHMSRLWDLLDAYNGGGGQR